MRSYLGRVYREMDVDHAVKWLEDNFRNRRWVYNDYHDHAWACHCCPLSPDDFSELARTVLADKPRLEKEYLERVLKPYREKRARNNLRRWRGPRIIS
jgi:hypothetical protein